MVASMESKETYYMLHISYTNSEISISLSYIRPYFVWWFQLYHCATLVLDLPTSILVLATVTLFTFHKSCRSCGSSLVLLRYFPSKILLIVQTTAIGHSIFYFSSFSMFIQSRILKSFVISSLCSFQCSFPLSIYSILLLPSLLSIPCSVFSLCLFTLLSDLPYCFLFKSVILSFLFSY